MTFVEQISDLEYYNSNPIWGCYHDIIVDPSDIILQVQLGTDYDISSAFLPNIELFKPDGVTSFGDVTNYFRSKIFYNSIGGVTYYYANIVCKTFSPDMRSNVCFVLNVRVPKNLAGTINYFNQFTQAYTLLNPSVVPVTGVTVSVDGSANVSSLCFADAIINTCNPEIVKLVWYSDCIDAFNGDFYGTGTTIISDTAADILFVRLTNLKGKLKYLPKQIKRTVSINCRTQRAETIQKYLLQIIDVPIPGYKMIELEGALLAQHIFVDGKEYQSDGGTPFTQLGSPQRCHYVYNMEMQLQDCFLFQDFGCTPACEPQISYYPIAF